MCRLKSFYCVGFIWSLMAGGVAFGDIYSTLETAEIPNPGDYKLNVATRWGQQEFTLLTALQVPFSESSSWGIGLGLGKHYLHLDANWKWTPIPDYENQPAIGLLFGLAYLHKRGGQVVYIDDMDSLAPASKSIPERRSLKGLYVHPLASKRMPLSSVGEIVVYGGPFIGLMFPDNLESYLPARLAIGSELFFDTLENWSFLLEVSLNIRRSANILSIGVSYLSFDRDE